MFTIALSSMLTLFVCMLVGFIGARKKIFDDQANIIFNKLLLNITVPAMFINAMNVSMEKDHLEKGIVVLIAGFGFHFIALLVSFLIVKIFHVKNKSMWIFCLTFANIGFLGFPLINDLFGSEMLFYASLFNVSFYILVFSIGILIVNGDSGVKVSVKKIILNPPFVGVCIGIVLFLMPFTLPQFISKTIAMFGNITPPLSMLVVGSVLASTNVLAVLRKGELYILSAVKLIVIPLIIYFIANFVISDKEIVVMITVLSGTPSAILSVVLAKTYNNNAILASEIVFVTTALSVITLPVITMLMTL